MANAISNQYQEHGKRVHDAHKRGNELANEDRPMLFAEGGQVKTRNQEVSKMGYTHEEIELAKDRFGRMLSTSEALKNRLAQSGELGSAAYEQGAVALARGGEVKNLQPENVLVELMGRYMQDGEDAFKDAPAVGELLSGIFSDEKIVNDFSSIDDEPEAEAYAITQDGNQPYAEMRKVKKPAPQQSKQAEPQGKKGDMRAEAEAAAAAARQKQEEEYNRNEETRRSLNRVVNRGGGSAAELASKKAAAAKWAEQDRARKEMQSQLRNGGRA